MPEELIAIILGGIFLMIPIVAILTKHQQRMAELMRPNRSPEGNPLELDMMRRDMEQLKQLVMQQTIAIDNLATQNRDLAARMNSSVQERIGPAA